MTSPLKSRVERIEERLPRPRKPRLIRIVASQEEEDAAYELARQEGIDISPTSKEIVVIRLVPGSRPESLQCRN